MSVGKESENTQPRKPWALYLQLAIRTLTCEVRNFVNMIIICIDPFSFTTIVDAGPWIREYRTHTTKDQE